MEGFWTKFGLFSGVGPQVTLAEVEALYFPLWVSTVFWWWGQKGRNESEAPTRG